MNTKSMCSSWGALGIGFILLIPGIILTVQSEHSEDSDNLGAGIPLLVVGFFLGLFGLMGVSSSNNSNSNAENTVDAATRDHIIAGNAAGQANGNWMAQSNNQFTQWQTDQQQQVQTSINNGYQPWT